MNYKKISGSIVALVTPFTDDGKIDYDAYKNLLDFHIQNGTNSILLCGTTGERSTLDDKEFNDFVETGIKHVGNRLPVIVGTGSNNTKKAIYDSHLAQSLGASACLVVGPYYNKPTDSGYLKHYEAIASSIKIPIIIYNVPGRTGSNIKASVTLKLSEISNIVGIKEASGNLDQITEILAKRPDDFSVLSGDDAMAYHILTLGGDGCISVVANEIPKEFSQLIKYGLEKNWAEAKEIHYKFFPLMKANFIESNPIPVKTALVMMGKIKENFRLPLCKMGEENKTKLKTILKNLNLI